MAELKNIRIAVSGLYDYAYDELPTLRVAMPGNGAPDWVEKKDIYKVYRPAPVLAAACDKFKMLPLTHHHPRVPVDGQNFRDLAVGYTGENPEVDYLSDKNEVGIKSTVMMYDDEALKAYDNGEIQLSPGYIAVFEWKKGTAPNGEPYDIIMKEITEVNHLALLPNGRGGEDAVVLDNGIAHRGQFDEYKDKVSVFTLVRNKLTDGAPIGNQNAKKDHTKEEDDLTEAKKIPKEIKNKKRANLYKEVAPLVNQGFINNKEVGKVLFSNHSAEKMGCDKALNKSLVNGFSVDEHYDAAERIGELFPDANLKVTHQDRDNDPNILDMKRFRKDFKTCEGNNASAWITVKNSKQHGNRLYTIEVMELKKADEKSAISGGADKQTHASIKNITDVQPKVKSIFEIVKGSVFDRVRK